MSADDPLIQPLPANAEEELRGVKAAKHANETLDEQQLGEEHGGRKEPLDPTRYGDWEAKGKCVDF